MKTRASGQQVAGLAWHAWMTVCHYRACPAGTPCADVGATVAAAPDRCAWGTDWLRMDAAPEAGLLPDRFVERVADGAARRKVLAGTPARLDGV
jgi:hypothetical protein